MTSVFVGIRRIGPALMAAGGLCVAAAKLHVAVMEAAAL